MKEQHPSGTNQDDKGIVYISILNKKIVLMLSSDGINAQCNHNDIESAGYCMKEIPKVMIIGNFRLQSLSVQS